MRRDNDTDFPEQLAVSGGAAAQPRKIFRVSELTRVIKMVLEDGVGTVTVEGEVSNFRRHSSGHVYFTLKDQEAQIDIVLFQSAARRVRFEIRDGQQLRVTGQVTIYEKSSRYQIVAKEVEPAGLGSLYEAFEKLKAKLKAEGLFDRPKKRLPLLPQHIGIVTSPTGAVIRDIIKVLRSRFPNIHLLVAPVRVQGEGAAQEIVEALDLLNKRGGLDVIILARGGGSLEDLWPFNEEIVARAIARSRIPVISAVGHETDVTISDFVADVRAPTPSAAAEMVIRRKDDFEKDLRAFEKRLRAALDQFVLRLEKRYESAAQSYVFREPVSLLNQHLQTLDHACEQMAALTGRVLEQREGRFNVATMRLKPVLHTLAERRESALKNAALRLGHQALRQLEAGHHRLERFREQLAALNPERVLQRGYSITRLHGIVVRDAAQVAPNENIEVQLARGWLRAQVNEIGKPTNGRNEEHGEGK